MTSKMAFAERMAKAERILWALVLVFLPVTSFRFLPFFGDSQVKPLSFLPLCLMIPLIAWRSIMHRRLTVWNDRLIPLIAFALVAMIASMLGITQAPSDLYENTYVARSLRAWITFAVGIAFLIVPMSQVRSEEDLRFTLRWLYVGLVVQSIISVAQIVDFYIIAHLYDGSPVADYMDNALKTVMMAGSSPNRRISGLALEPSWLAAQMAVVYFPWTFASLLSGYSLHKRKWHSFLYLLLVILLCVLTYSRSGLVILLISALLATVMSGWQQSSGFLQWIRKPFRSAIGKRAQFSRLAVILGIAGGMLFILFLLTQSSYFSALWQARGDSIEDYFVNIYAGPRFALMQAGFNVFEERPWLGVGLGGAGFYLHSAIPDWAHFNISEISILFSSTYTGIPNTKNLYVRLLAETGIIGFWLFLSFYLGIFGYILQGLRLADRYHRFFFTAGAVSLFSILGLGFSQDSLAMPIIWLPFGILLGLNIDIRKV